MGLPNDGQKGSARTPLARVVVLDADQGRGVRLAARYLRRTCALDFVPDVDAFLRELPAHRCGLLGGGIPDRLVERSPLVAEALPPLIHLVDAPGSDALRLPPSGSPAVHELLPEDVPSGLFSTLSCLLIDGSVVSTRRAVISNPALHRRAGLRRVVLHLLDFSRQPIHSVQALARAGRVATRTLELQWATLGARRLATLKDLVEIVLLLRALQDRSKGVCWRTTDVELGIDPRTRRSASRRQLGRLLPDPGTADSPASVLRLEEKLQDILP